MPQPIRHVSFFSSLPEEGAVADNVETSPIAPPEQTDSSSVVPSETVQDLGATALDQTCCPKAILALVSHSEAHVRWAVWQALASAAAVVEAEDVDREALCTAEVGSMQHRRADVSVPYTVGASSVSDVLVSRFGIYLFMSSLLPFVCCLFLVSRRLSDLGNAMRTLPRVLKRTGRGRLAFLR